MKLILPLVCLLFFASCKRDPCKDPSVPGCNQNEEEELITTIELLFTDPSDSTFQLTAVFTDPDGPGGNSPESDTIVLDTNHIYYVSLSVRNESDSSNIINLTPEILAEGDEHFICFIPPIASFLISSTDSDGTYPIGLNSKWESIGAVSSTVRVMIKHQPAGLKNGTCVPGETDAEVDFPILVE